MTRWTVSMSSDGRVAIGSYGNDGNVYIIIIYKV